LIQKIKRRIRYYSERVRSNLHNGLYSRKIDGYKIYSNSISLFRLYQNFRNTGTYNFKSDSSNPYIIDCGANIGLATLFFKKLYPDSKILCFEPSKEVIPILNKNIKENKLTNVTVLPFALHNVERKIEFNTNEIMSGTISQNKNLPYTYEVQTKILSDYIDCKVDFLKMDIEGAEILVLPEIENKLHKVQNIFIEYHSFIAEKQKLDMIFSILTRNGFRYYVEGEFEKIQDPLISFPNNLGQDLQLCIWAKRI